MQTLGGVVRHLEESFNWKYKKVDILFCLFTTDIFLKRLVVT